MKGRNKINEDWWRNDNHQIVTKSIWNICATWWRMKLTLFDFYKVEGPTLLKKSHVNDYGTRNTTLKLKLAFQFAKLSNSVIGLKFFGLNLMLEELLKNWLTCTEKDDETDPKYEVCVTHKYAPNIFCWTIANSAHSDTKQNRGDNLQKKPYLKIKPIAKILILIVLKQHPGGMRFYSLGKLLHCSYSILASKLWNITS